MGDGLVVLGPHSSLSSEDSLLLIKLLPDPPFPLFGPESIKCFHPEGRATIIPAETSILYQRLDNPSRLKSL